MSKIAVVIIILWLLIFNEKFFLPLENFHKTFYNLQFQLILNVILIHNFLVTKTPNASQWNVKTCNANKTINPWKNAVSMTAWVTNAWNGQINHQNIARNLIAQTTQWAMRQRKWNARSSSASLNRSILKKMMKSHVKSLDRQSPKKSVWNMNPCMSTLTITPNQNVNAWKL